MTAGYIEYGAVLNFILLTPNTKQLDVKTMLKSVSGNVDLYINNCEMSQNYSFCINKFN